jgi:spermidine synthase
MPGKRGLGLKFSKLMSFMSNPTLSPQAFPLLLVGFVSILTQVILLRELNVALYGVELIYLTALGVWLLATGMGCLLGQRLNSSLAHLSLIFSLLVVILPIEVLFIRDSRQLMAGIPGSFLDFPQQMLVVGISIVPISLVQGMLFQWAARFFMEGGCSLAAAYAIESLGGAAGGLASTLTLRYGISNWVTALCCCLVCLSLPLLVGFKTRSLRLAFFSITLCLGIFSLFYVAPEMDWRMTSWSHPALLDSRDTPYGRITLTRLEGQISVFENDVLCFETESYDAELFAHLAALNHPDPQQLLILGGGLEGLIDELQKYKPERIDWVELNPAMVRVVQQHLAQRGSGAASAPNVHLTFADPRHFLEHSEYYDLILIGMGEPASGQTNRFYTREFFLQCSQRLKRGGILAFRLRSLENYWTPFLSLRNGSIWKALQEVFPNNVVLPGNTNYFIASRQRPLPVLETLIARKEGRQISTRLLTKPFIQYLYTNDRLAEIAAAMKTTTSIVNSDQHPVVYQYTLLIWLSKFFPDLMHLGEKWSFLKVFYSGPWNWILFLNLAVLFFIAGFFPKSQRLVQSFMAGFLGMGFETILFLYYQVKNGVLFQDLGVLLTCYMVGLTAGAWALDVLTSAEKGWKTDGRIAWVSVIGFLVVVMGSTGWLIQSGHSHQLIVIGLLQFMGAFFTSALFALASLSGKDNPLTSISPLYSADLAGGAVGAVLCSLGLIPLLGLPSTLYGMSLLSALLFLAFSKRATGFF